MSEEDLKDIEELKKVLEVVGEKVPPLISGLINSVLNKQDAEDYAKQVSTFYSSLKESGMSEENAMKLTKEFMASRDPMSLVKKLLSESDVGSEIFSKMGKKGRHKEEDDEEEEEKEDD